LGDVALVSSNVDVHLIAGDDVNLRADANVLLDAGTAVVMETPAIDLTDQKVDLDIRAEVNALDIRAVLPNDVGMMEFDGREDQERVVVPVGLSVGGEAFDGTADDDEITLASYGMAVKAVLEQTAVGAVDITDVSQIVAQPNPLGELDADYQSLTAVAGKVSNKFYVRDFLVRNEAGADWETASYRRGISIDQSYETPALLRSWYEFNPHSGTGNVGTVSFGSEGTTFGTMGPEGLLLAAASDYLNFDGVAGSTGIGIRSNSGVIESKNSGGEWGALGTLPDDSETTGGGKLTGDTTTTVLVTDAGTTTRLTGDRVQLSGQTTGTDAGLTPSQINGTYMITAVGATTYNITMPAAASAEVFGDSTMKFGYFSKASSAIAGNPSISPGVQGKLDLGPLRIIFNTIDSTGTTGPLTEITLGDGGKGTDFTMATQLFSCWCQKTEQDEEGRDVISGVVNGVLKDGPLTFYATQWLKTREISYWCLGDSGA